jgi:hypothetical protein
MADLGTNNPEFKIGVSLNGQERNLHVKPDETSDGIEYFVVFDDENELTQIRLEAEGGNKCGASYRKKMLTPLVKR